MVVFASPKKLERMKYDTKHVNLKQINEIICFPIRYFHCGVSLGGRLEEVGDWGRLLGELERLLGNFECLCLLITPSVLCFWYQLLVLSFRTHVEVVTLHNAL